ncbi:transposase [Klebsiella pneumoniae]|uniref:Transposase n=1 Tax=Klebsiella pneumoniae TaxID=573 RepID=A0A4P0Y0E5_KLEPN|nr:transposase [Klebsiella pneumoniae]
MRQKANEKWVTDVTEFPVQGKKLYLSSVLDLFNREVIAYSLSERPVMEMVNTMLDGAFPKLRPGDAPLLHSDSKNVCVSSHHHACCFVRRGEITDAVKTFRLPDSHSDRPRNVSFPWTRRLTESTSCEASPHRWRVTQEGPDVLSPYCPVRVIVRRNDDKFQKGLGYGED